MARPLPDGVGGAFVVWEDRRSGDTDVYAQRVNPSGTMLWAKNGVAVCAADSSQFVRSIVADRSGGAIIG